MIYSDDCVNVVAEWLIENAPEVALYCINTSNNTGSDLVARELNRYPQRLTYPHLVSIQVRNWLHAGKIAVAKDRALVNSMEAGR